MKALYIRKPQQLTRCNEILKSSLQSLAPNQSNSIRRQFSQSLATPSITNVKSALEYGENQLRNSLQFKHIEHDAEGEARQLLFHALCPSLKRTPMELYNQLKRDKVVSCNELTKFKEFVGRRCNYEPMEYIVGNVDFFGRNFKVNSRVLIPRVDSEVLIETTLTEVLPKILKRKGVSSFSQIGSPLNIMEIGVGSGCLIITLLLEFQKRGIENFRAFGIDKSKEALEVATSNAQSLLPNYIKGHKIEFIEHDIFKDDWKHKDLEMDLIISNPPYIPTSVVHNELDKDVSNHEPHLALDGGLDGFDFYNYLLVENALKTKYNIAGHCIMEVGYDQATELKERMTKNSKLQFSGVAKDLSGYDRVVLVESCSNFEI